MRPKPRSASDQTILERLKAKACRRIVVDGSAKGSTCFCIGTDGPVAGVYIHVYEGQWTEERPVERGGAYYVGKSDTNIFREAFSKPWLTDGEFRVAIVPTVGASRTLVGGLEAALIERLQPFQNIYGTRPHQHIASDVKLLAELIVGAAGLGDRPDGRSGARPEPRRTGEFAFDFRTTRMYYSLSRKQVARVCRVSADVINDWESGYEAPEDIEAVLAALRDPKRSLLWRKKDVDMSWADWLRELRSQKGFTQQDVASLLGVTQVTVSQWEAGRVHPVTVRRERVAEAIKSAAAKPEGQRSARGRKALKAGRAL